MDGVLAAEIWITEGAVILAFLGLMAAGWMVVGCLKLKEIWAEKRLEKRIRDAQEFQLAPGVALLDGIRAFFDMDGHWEAAEQGSVCVKAGIVNHCRATLYVYPAEGRIVVYMFRQSGDAWENNNPKALMDALVKVARSMAAFPEKQEGGGA